MKHRKEEDDLYRKFARQREEEDKRMREEFRVSAAVNRAQAADGTYWRWMKQWSTLLMPYAMWRSK